MKRTLLDMTQEILSEMDSDEVNSIDDTIESQQVAGIIKSCYFEMMSNRTWDFAKKMMTFDSLSDTSKPSTLSVPDTVKEVIFFRYNNTKATGTTQTFADVKYLYPDEFLRYTSGRNTSNENTVIVTDISGVQLFILNNSAPQFWTSFDDKYITCDSYDASVDDTLKSSKTQVYAVSEPVWIHTDLAVPQLPSEAFSALVEEAKSQAFLTLKQTANQKAEQKAVRQQRWLSRKQWVAHGGVRYDNYGRRPRK